MGQAEAHQALTLSCSEKHFIEVATSSLIALRYTVLEVNNKFNQIVATAKDTQQYGHDVWHFEYRVHVSWALANDGLNIAVSVAEPSYPHQAHECQERVNALLARMTQLAVITANDAPAGTTYGSATWATSEELAQGDYIIASARDFVGNRFLLGRYNGEELSIPENLTHRHVLICGPTGCGKTTGLFIPNLIERTGVSAIVTEATPGSMPPNLYAKTAGWRAMAGQEIFYFNPSDLTSTRINPIDQVQTFDDAAHLATLIIQNSTPASSYSDPIWQQSETHLLTSLVWHTAGRRGGKPKADLPDHATLGYIRALLRAGPAGVSEDLKATNRELARLEFEAFLKNTSPNFRFGVISGLMQRLNLWVSPKIQTLTAVTDFQPEQLQRQLFTFYLAVSVARPEYKPLAAMIFNFLLDVVLNGDFDHPLALFLDEFTNYGYIPAFADKLTIIRNKKIGAVLGVQDFVQLRKVYGDDDAKLLSTQPGTRIFFRPQDSQMAKRISGELGMTTLYTRKVNSRGNTDEREQPRPLLDASELMRLPVETTIAFLPTANPAQVQRFDWSDYIEATHIEPPVRNPWDLVDEPRFKPITVSQGSMAGDADSAQPTAAGGIAPQVCPAQQDGPGDRQPKTDDTASWISAVDGDAPESWVDECVQTRASGDQWNADDLQAGS